MFYEYRQDLARLTGRTGFAAWLRACLTVPGFIAVSIFRLQSAIFRSPLRPLAYVLFTLNQLVTGAEFAPGCDIGPGLIVRHPSGVVIGRGARIGANCTLLHHVTLGEKHGDGRDELHG